MKKLILLLCVSGLITYSCNKEILPEPFNIGLEENFQIGEDYQANDNALKFKISVINDSRCPSDVVCIWQGEAVVNITVKSPQAGTIELSTYDNLIDTVGSYSFELVSVSPYPISTKTIKPEDYKVALKIEKLTDGN